MQNNSVGLWWFVLFCGFFFGFVCCFFVLVVWLVFSPQIQSIFTKLLCKIQDCSNTLDINIQNKLFVFICKVL